jgi:L-lactate dehydrogenase (cytochrome)
LLKKHPGGVPSILDYAGKDATLAYEAIHSPETIIKNLPPSKHLGHLDLQAERSLAVSRDNRIKSNDERRIERAHREKPPLSQILNLKDMEVWSWQFIQDCSLNTLLFLASSSESSQFTGTRLLQLCCGRWN